jgi:hypothetical protein
MPDTLTIIREWMELLNGIADTEERWRVLSAVFAFANTENAKKKDMADGLSPIGKSVFMTICKKLNTRKRVARFYTKHKSEALESNGKSVRIRRKNLTEKAYESNAYDLFPETSNQHSITNISPSCIDKSIQCSPTGKNSTARRVFKVPTLEEVRDYISDKGYSVDPEEFFSFYESQGWHVGKNKMRDWHRAVSYWQCRINNRNKTRAQLRDYSGI